MFKIGQEVVILDIRPASMRHFVVGKTGTVRQVANRMYSVSIAGGRIYSFSEDQLRAADNNPTRCIVILSAHASCDGQLVAVLDSMTQLYDWLDANTWLGRRLYTDGSEIFIDSGSSIRALRYAQCNRDEVPAYVTSPIITNIVPRDQQLDEYDDGDDDDE